MLVTIILLTACGIVRSSEIHQVAPSGAAPIVTAASSQYFERTFNRLVAAPPVFEHVLPVAPVPVAPAVPQPVFSVIPVAPEPPVVVDARRTTSVPVNPTNASPPSSPGDPNIAIAVATAHAAAPVATILLPPYPFGFPPSFGIFPQAPVAPQAPTDFNTRESTTPKTITTVQATTTQREEDPTTPVPSNVDNSFAQPLPSNQDVNFREYLAPQPPEQGVGPQQQFPGSNQRPQQFPGQNQIPQQFPGTNQTPQQFFGPNQRPQQFPGPNQSPNQFSGPDQTPQQFPDSNQKPQQFFGPNQRPQQFPRPNQTPQQLPGYNPRPQQLPIPSPWPQHGPQHLPLPDARPIKFKTNVEVLPVPLAYIAPPSPHHDHHHHHHHHHQSLRVPHIHTYIPKTSKIIIRPVTSPLRIRTIRVPAGFATYGPPVKRVAPKYSYQNIRSSLRDIELTTFRPINRPYSKQQKL